MTEQPKEINNVIAEKVMGWGIPHPCFEPYTNIAQALEALEEFCKRRRTHFECVRVQGVDRAIWFVAIGTPGCIVGGDGQKYDIFRAEYEADDEYLPAAICEALIEWAL